ncbi:chitin deacetylase 8-like [Ylistrum balloti]|uniref:chitin deacetylase 8-like n=1 Tax=Ylistrum balloti TaxID=509963 RepID=UPI0029059217|nr:chitin deacetylase 8-like [Ylistrum balloti]
MHFTYVYTICIAASCVHAKMSCDDSACVLPACRCFSDRSIPGYLSPFQTPQIVTITLENNISSVIKPLYDSLLNFRNPNNCSIRVSFYIDDSGTDYSIVTNYASQGHEIGIQSINGTPPNSSADWIHMIKYMKTRLGRDGIPSSYGVRAPHLSFGGTNEYIGIQTNDMMYDSSCVTSEFVSPGTLKWPFTYDYDYGMFKCDIGTSVDRPFPGRWQVMLAAYRYKGVECAVPDSCENVKTEAEAFDIIYEAFLDHYLGDRAPYTVVISPAWMLTDYKRAGLINFLTNITTHRDVWLVSQIQAIQWVKQPTSLDHILEFPPWTC